MRIIGKHQAALICATFLAIAGAGCTERRLPADVGALPVSATAYPSPTPTDGRVAVSPPQDIQAVGIHIVDGRFGADIYDVQARSARLEVSGYDGDYRLAVDGLVAEQPLDADGATIISLTLPNPGRYTMRLSGESSATATLNVRPAGER